MNGEPVSLRRVAEAIRNESWLDMHVCDLGKLDRVRISQLNIGRERDEVIVWQKWLDGEDLYSESHQFDVEDIIWLRETRVALEDVRPIRRREEPPPQAQGGIGVRSDLAKRIIDEIILTQVFADPTVTEKDLRGGDDKSHRHALRSRQEAMWMAYEMTDLPAREICVNHFGYHSQQPLLSISYGLERFWAGLEPWKYDAEWIGRVKATAAVVDGYFPQKFRRTSPGPWKTFL